MRAALQCVVVESKEKCPPYWSVAFEVPPHIARTRTALVCSSQCCVGGDARELCAAPWHSSTYQILNYFISYSILQLTRLVTRCFQGSLWTGSCTRWCVGWIFGMCVRFLISTVYYRMLDCNQRWNLKYQLLLVVIRSITE